MSDPTTQQLIDQQRAKRTADYRQAHAKRDAALAKEDQLGLPGIASAPPLANLQIRSIAIKNAGSRAATGNVPLEIVLSGAAQSDGLELIRDNAYYQAFLALAQTFLKSPTEETSPNETDEQRNF